jgi:hypothetical protein
MEKNIRKNPFANNQIENTPAVEKKNVPPSKVINTVTNAPPKFKNIETSSEDIYKPQTPKQETKPTPQLNTNHYNDESNDLTCKEFEGLKQFNASKNFLRLTTEK